jgi:hypothetical protein
MPPRATPPVVKLLTILLFCLLICDAPALAQRKRRPPAGGRLAVVVDERLAAVREAPDLSAGLVQRLGRGRLVAVSGARESAAGVRFLRVEVTRRTGGWVQAEAFVQPSRAGDDARLLRLVRASRDFDLLQRARIFLENFPRSPLRAEVLMLFGDAAERAAERLTREAARRLDPREMEAGGATPASYFLNYNGLDRLNRIGVRFVFDGAGRRFRYDGAAWREVVRRHPRAPEAAEARRRLDRLGTVAR